jgi:hypothetical protein
VEPTAKGALLWSRATLVAFVALATGAVGHVSAGGLLPSPLVLLGLVGFAVPWCAALLTRPATTRRLVLVLMAGQTVVHVLLSATAGHRGDPDPATSTGHRSAEAVLPLEGGRRVGSLLDGYEATGHGGGAVEPALPVGSLLGEISSHAPMMVAHLVAAALVGAWLAVGEHSLWALLALATRVLLGPVLAALAWLRLPALVVPSPCPADPVRPRPSRLLLARTFSRRGPPALLAA